MENAWSWLLMGVGGLLVGGVISSVRAKRVVPAIVLSVLAVLALGAAVAWWPTGGGS